MPTRAAHVAARAVGADDERAATRSSRRSRVAAWRARRRRGRRARRARCRRAPRRRGPQVVEQQRLEVVLRAAPRGHGLTAASGAGGGKPREKPAGPVGQRRGHRGGQPQSAAADGVLLEPQERRISMVRVLTPVARGKMDVLRGARREHPGACEPGSEGVVSPRARPRRPRRRTCWFPSAWSCLRPASARAAGAGSVPAYGDSVPRARCLWRLAREVLPVLGQQAGHVRLDGADGEEEPLGDLRVGQAPSATQRRARPSPGG